MTVLIYAQSKDRKTLADKLVAYSNLPRQEAENLHPARDLTSRFL